MAKEYKFTQTKEQLQALISSIPDKQDKNVFLVTKEETINSASGTLPDDADSYLYDTNKCDIMAVGAKIRVSHRSLPVPLEIKDGATGTIMADNVSGTYVIKKEILVEFWNGSAWVSTLTGASAKLVLLNHTTIEAELAYLDATIGTINTELENI